MKMSLQGQGTPSPFSLFCNSALASLLGSKNDTVNKQIHSKLETLFI